MENRTPRLIVVGLLIAAAVALFVVLSDDETSDEPTGTATEATAPDGNGTEPAPAPEPRVETFVIQNGEVKGGTRRIAYNTGETVRMVVRLDETYEEIHVHGYDLTKTDVSGTQRLQFKAELEGIYEVEAHGAVGDVILAELEVRPG